MDVSPHVGATWQTRLKMLNNITFRPIDVLPHVLGAKRLRANRLRGEMFSVGRTVHKPCVQPKLLPY